MIKNLWKKIKIQYYGWKVTRDLVKAGIPRDIAREAVKKIIDETK